MHRFSLIFPLLSFARGIVQRFLLISPQSSFARGAMHSFPLVESYPDKFQPRN